MADKDKFRKMLQMELPVRRVQRYVTSQPWNTGKTSITFHLDVDFRPTHILTNLTERGKASLSQIFVNQNLSVMPALDSSVSWLLAPVDCYEYSMELKQRLQQECYEELGLVGKTFDQIDRYLDSHEMSIPDPNRIELPSVRKGGAIQLRGETSIDFMISLLGDAVG